MDKYNGLLSKVSRQYHILRGNQETADEWKTRLVYSICGMMAYASLWDDTEECQRLRTYLLQGNYLQSPSKRWKNKRLSSQ